MLRIGIFGAGWITENAHLPACFDNSFSVEVLIDNQIEKAKFLAEKYNIRNYRNKISDEIWELLDAVIIAMPNYLHYQFSKDALLHGKHVLCEKPITFQYQEVVELSQIAEKMDVVFMPGFVNEYRDDVIKLKSLVENNCIGTVKCVNGGWIRENGIPRLGSWFTQKKLSGGGVLVDLGSHIFDIMTLICGKNTYDPIESFELETEKTDNLAVISSADWMASKAKEKAFIDVEIQAYAKITYEDKMQLNCVLSWNTNENGDLTYFYIEGTDGVVMLNTLFGFSNHRRYHDSFMILEQNNGERIIYKFERDMNLRAFKRMLGVFARLIEKDKFDYEMAERAKNSVFIIHNLYAVQSETEGKEKKVMSDHTRKIENIMNRK